MRAYERAARLLAGRNVQRLRKSRGLTQEQLAEAVGNNWKHIGQIERGEVNVGIDYLAGIAHALKVETSDLLAVPARRRRSEPPLYLVDRRELEQLEHLIRSIRSAQSPAPDNDAE